MNYFLSRAISPSGRSFPCADFQGLGEPLKTRTQYGLVVITHWFSWLPFSVKPGKAEGNEFSEVLWLKYEQIGLLIILLTRAGRYFHVFQNLLSVGEFKCPDLGNEVETAVS